MCQPGRSTVLLAVRATHTSQLRAGAHNLPRTMPPDQLYVSIHVRLDAGADALSRAHTSLGMQLAPHPRRGGRLSTSRSVLAPIVVPRPRGWWRRSRGSTPHKLHPRHHIALSAWRTYSSRLLGYSYSSHSRSSARHVRYSPGSAGCSGREFDLSQSGSIGTLSKRSASKSIADLIESGRNISTKPSTPARVFGGLAIKAEAFGLMGDRWVLSVSGTSRGYPSGSRPNSVVDIVPRIYAAVQREQQLPAIECRHAGRSG